MGNKIKDVEKIRAHKRLGYSDDGDSIPQLTTEIHTLLQRIEELERAIAPLALKAVRSRDDVDIVVPVNRSEVIRAWQVMDWHGHDIPPIKD